MTYQYADLLYYEKRRITLNNELLEAFFNDHPDKRPEIEVHETALWRGHVATFELLNNELLVKDVEILSSEDEHFKSVLNEVFPRSKKCDWYSGLIRIDDFRGRFDDEPKDGVFQFLEIKNGDLIKKRVMNFDQLQSFKAAQFEYFMLFDDPKRIYDFFKQNDDQISEERVNEIIRERILYYTREVYVH